MSHSIHKKKKIQRVQKNHALCCPGHPRLPLLHWCTWPSPLLSSCTHLWQSGRKRGAHLLLIHNSRGWPTHSRPDQSHPLGYSFSQLSTWQSNYVLEFSRSRLNPLVTMVGKLQTHELSAWFSSFLCLSIFSLTHAQPPPRSHSHSFRKEEMKIQLRTRVITAWWTHTVITHQINAVQVIIVAHR